MITVSQVEFTGLGVVACRKVEMEPPPLRPDEVRLALSHLGICGSELHVLDGHHPFAKPPMVTGHEISARVVELGAAVTSVAVGDHVVADPIMPCLQCRACRAGRFNLCEPPQVAGFRAPGFGRSSLVVPARNLHVAARNLSLSVLAFAEPAACAHHCISRLPVPCREDVLVIGAGTIGLSIVQALRIMGAGRITVIEPEPRKRDLACTLGAHRAVAPGGLDAAEKFTGVIDVVAAQATLTEACTRVVAGGTVICMGVPTGPREIPLPMMQRFERDLLSSGMYVPGDFDAAIGWLESGAFDTSALITDVFPVEQAEAAYARAREPSSIKVMIAFD
ncbi:Alcohol dehydrogenase catalytic domain-containing protein [Rhodovastum atsumiense]|uniref:Alcohol dehydrogenase catalytic domain-containing protein n=1 Tax=Rhodovastum atsumiense TaxID=504468 RepID=A0A5M6IWE6_9PROT|nr:alcohol dehydrogenase catalytic domain-containing protein [Rhodovastum atsumiense]KAA5612157.1 alcohol dehydrogenase catalytic domain-containing protein [Rhodovastum atsumiense]CAH2603897.1 Alcohol dehydrogenase catalytic domain-containing protein [Rhodovastum atsumiense]